MKTHVTQGSKSNAETRLHQRSSSSAAAAPAMSPSHGMSPDQMLELQSHAGNQEVIGMTQLSPSSSSSSLPAPIRAGVEALSGMSMDHVNVHHNSDKPPEIQALAYAQGTDIHIGPGQEKHIPHEGWHVAQQKQGRVRPTLQI
jgi:hypothetical protein